MSYGRHTHQKRIDDQWVEVEERVVEGKDGGINNSGPMVYGGVKTMSKVVIRSNERVRLSIPESLRAMGFLIFSF